MLKYLLNIYSNRNIRKYLGSEDNEFVYKTDVLIVFLILFNSFVFILQTFDFDKNIMFYLNSIDNTLILIFTIEIGLRFIAQGHKLNYFKNIYNLIDIVAIIPFWFGFTQSQILRLLRFFKIFRYSNKYLVHLSNSKSSNIEKIFILRILFIIYIVLYFSSFLVLIFEKEINPHINNFSDAFYFTLVTLTTVGFGDITAETQVGRVIVVCIIIIGLLIIPWNTGFLIKHIVFSNTKVRCLCPKCHLIYHDRDSKYCKNCGTKIFISKDLK